MKNTFLFTLAFTFGTSLAAQTYFSAENREPGKCYEYCFELDKKIEWKEVDCNKENRPAKTEAELLKSKEILAKLPAYQAKLKSLGYKLDISGKVDLKTIDAHVLYMSDLEKAERKRLKADKKKVKAKAKADAKNNSGK